jgi:SAM-dependent methyltransferase
MKDGSLPIRGSKDAELDKWATWLLYQRFQDKPVQERERAVTLLKRIRDEVLDSAKLQNGTRVLDLGAGTGLLALGVAERLNDTTTIVAVDLSADSLHVCSSDALKAGRAISCIVANGLDLPFRKDIFHAIVIRSVLIYVVDKTLLLNECCRVLDAGGILSLFEPINRDRAPDVDLSTLPQWLKDRIKVDRQRAVKNDDPMLNFGEEDLLNAVSVAGFTDIKVRREIVKEELLDIQAVDGYFSRVPAPGQLCPKEYLERLLGGNGFHLYREHWISALQHGPINIETPTVFVSARKAE